VLWNRTLSKAEEALRGLPSSNHVAIRELQLEALQKELAPKDIVVSMLPATMHTEIAELCLAKGAHLVTTSYISPAMQALHDWAKEKGLCFINESGLDPGIDHILAHLLVEEYKSSADYNPIASVSFQSYCGGFPKEADDFRYKFSWSPLGVLRALTNEARYIGDFSEKKATRAWEAIRALSIAGEEFETYPNRNSLPYIQEYGFSPSWRIEEFIRGTIRLGGWSQAWASIFEEIAQCTNDSDQKRAASRLEALSQELWRKHSYSPEEEDRVVLYVAFSARHNETVIWKGAYLLDLCGTNRDTAMARLVSLPATYAVESIDNGAAPTGVSGAPHSPAEIRRWLQELKKESIEIQKLA
jgi:saccharopine dehydrogenase (NADP+, L-glutamate forming)